MLLYKQAGCQIQKEEEGTKDEGYDDLIIA